MYHLKCTHQYKRSKHLTWQVSCLCYSTVCSVHDRFFVYLPKLQQARTGRYFSFSCIYIFVFFNEGSVTWNVKTFTEYKWKNYMYYRIAVLSIFVVYLLSSWFMIFTYKISSLAKSSLVFSIEKLFMCWKSVKLMETSWSWMWSRLWNKL